MSGREALLLAARVAIVLIAGWLLALIAIEGGR